MNIGLCRFCRRNDTTAKGQLFVAIRRESLPLQVADATVLRSCPEVRALRRPSIFAGPIRRPRMKIYDALGVKVVLPILDCIGKAIAALCAESGGGAHLNAGSEQHKSFIGPARTRHTARACVPAIHVSFPGKVPSRKSQKRTLNVRFCVIKLPFCFIPSGSEKSSYSSSAGSAGAFSSAGAASGRALSVSAPTGTSAS